jgi:YkoY family integral membrane protein
MIPQTFETADIGKIGALLILEALLSADNALILAIIVRHLPKDQQKKALFYGLAGAFALRFAAILLAASILNFWWLQLVGALYLIYLPVKHFIKHASGPEVKGREGAGFWMTVIYADLADLAFAIDSVLVAVAIVNRQDKIWVIYAGAGLGIILLRFAAGWCLRLLEKYPVLDHVAYALVGWAGIKLLFVSGHTFGRWWEGKNPGQSLGFAIPEMHPGVFWTGMALIVIFGTFLAVSKGAQEAALTDEQEEMIGDIEAAEEQFGGSAPPSDTA